MGRFDDNPEDIKRAADEGEKAGDAGSMFIAKTRLKTHHSKIQVAFLQLPQFGTVTYKDGKTSARGQVNVASFLYDEKAEDYVYEGIFLLEMAPKHINRFLAKLQKPQYNRGMLYEIERNGHPNDTDTFYEMEQLRDLTAEELEFLETVDLYELFKRGEQSTDDTPPPAMNGSRVSDPGYKAWNTQVIAEAKRIGWADEYLAGNIKMAIKTFFGEAIHGTDMTIDQRNRFLEGLGAMETGAKPGEIGYGGIEVGEPIDLDEDVNFF